MDGRAAKLLALTRLLDKKANDATMLVSKIGMQASFVSLMGVWRPAEQKLKNSLSQLDHEKFSRWLPDERLRRCIELFRQFAMLKAHFPRRALRCF